MGSDAEDMIKDLLRNELTIDEDFTFLDAGGLALDLSMNPAGNIRRRHDVELKVDWLKSSYTGEGFYVWYHPQKTKN